MSNVNNEPHRDTAEDLIKGVSDAQLIAMIDSIEEQSLPKLGSWNSSKYT